MEEQAVESTDSKQGCDLIKEIEDLTEKTKDLAIGLELAHGNLPAPPPNDNLKADSGNSEGTILNLPIELLTKIFSFCDTDDRLRAAEVCEKFKDVVMCSAAWQTAEISVQQSEDLFKSVRFFIHFHKVKRFSLKSENRKLRSDLSSEMSSAIDDLLVNMSRLCCLNVENFVLSPGAIKLPSTLKHLNYSHLHSHKEFIFLENCPDIEHIYLDDRHPSGLCSLLRDTSRVKLLLKRYGHSLRSLYLGSSTLDADCVKEVADFPNLRELGLYGTVHEVSLFSFSNHELLSRLETLYVNGWKAFGNHLLEYIVDKDLSELRHLTLINCGICADGYMSLLKKIPKLETICIDLTLDYANLFWIYKFVGNCKTLQNVAFYSKYYCAHSKRVKDGINEFILSLGRLIQTKNFKSVCFCSFMKPSQANEMIRVDNSQNSNTFSCTKCNLWKFSSNKCYCWLSEDKMKTISLN